MIPFVNLQKQRDFYKNEFLEAEKEVLDSGCFIGGPQVDNLEKELVDYIGLPDLQAISCGSGTDAITIALMALGLKPGDEVIVPDFTFIAPAECVALLGGTPRFADINNQTLQIDPESVRSLITDRTVGIIGVDLFGQCAPFKNCAEFPTSTDSGCWKTQPRLTEPSAGTRRLAHWATFPLQVSTPPSLLAVTETAGPCSLETANWPKKCERLPTTAARGTTITKSSV